MEDGKLVRTAASQPSRDIDRKRLRRCVEASIERLETPKKTKRDLRNIWQELSRRHENGLDMPTRRKLSAQLRHPKATGDPAL